MQIRTGLAIGAGIAVGLIVGMGVSEDTKCKFFGKIRKDIIHALGGEVKKVDYTKTNYRTSYTNYNTVYKKRTVDRRRCEHYELFRFDSEEKANECFDEIRKFLQTYGILTVIDLAHMRGKTIDYTWDAYGWDREDLNGVEITKVGSKYEIDLPMPKLLK